MKRFSKQATAIALLAVAIFAVPGGNSAIAAKSNCKSVNKTYPFGIALNKQSIGTSRAKVIRTKYIQLKYLDKDLDGIVCEIEKLQAKVTTPVTTPVTTTTTLVSLACASGGACFLGNTGPGGGIVFYDAGSTQPWGRYLEAPPTNLEGMYRWSNAIDAAQAYRGGGLTDWRLPTKDELNLLYSNKEIVGDGYGWEFTWSSSEFNATYAWLQNLLNGQQRNLLKTTTLFVRPVRAF